MREHEWEAEGEHWVRWARTARHDAYWFYRDAFFEGFLPAAGERTLEVGCGEGRVVRDLEAHGHNVAAVDISFTLLRHATERDRSAVFALSDASSLPFRDSSFDLVVAYNSLQVVADMAGTVRESARVLRAGGHLAACVSHPVTDLAEFESDDEDARLMLRPNYFANEWVDDTVAREGLTMRFTGWTYTLEDYASALANAGFQLSALREPRPSTDEPRYRRRQRVPMFLLLLAVKAA